jgi:hypothetical protein
MVTPWAGYITKPFAIPVINPFSKSLKEMVKNPKELFEEVKENLIDYGLEEGATSVLEQISEKGLTGAIDSGVQSVQTGLNTTIQTVKSAVNRGGG